MKMVLFSMAAAIVLTFGLILPHDMMAVSLASVIFGAIGIGLLAIGAKNRPAWALSIWGGVFVPASGVWVIPSFETRIEIFWVMLGLAACGALVYGGTAAVLSIVLRGPLSWLRFIVVPLAVPLAEYLAMQSGLVMAPVGLLAVVGGWAWGVDAMGAIAAGGVLLLLATAFASTSHQGARTAMLVVVMLVTFAPAPSRPVYTGPQITAIAHNPDPVGKWTEQGAQDGLDRLLAQSEAARGLGLIVWPENAVSGTFSVEEAVAQMGDVPTPLLFGMTRYAAAGSPALRNSAILLDEDGVQISDKEILAPGLETGLRFDSRSYLQRGERRLLILNGSTLILPLICYEIAFPIAASDFSDRPDVIINIAAQTGFITWMAEAIAQRHARARELEAGIRVVRVSDVDRN